MIEFNAAFLIGNFLKVLVLLVMAFQQVNLPTIKKTKFAGKTTLPQRPIKHF